MKQNIKKTLKELWKTFKGMTKENFNSSDAGKIINNQLSYINKEDRDDIKNIFKKLFKSKK